MPITSRISSYTYGAMFERAILRIKIDWIGKGCKISKLFNHNNSISSEIHCGGIGGFCLFCEYLDCQLPLSCFSRLGIFLLQLWESLSKRLLIDDASNQVHYFMSKLVQFSFCIWQITKNFWINRLSLKNNIIQNTAKYLDDYISIYYFTYN